MLTCIYIFFLVFWIDEFRPCLGKAHFSCMYNTSSLAFSPNGGINRSAWMTEWIRTNSVYYYRGEHENKSMGKAALRIILMQISIPEYSEIFGKKKLYPLKRSCIFSPNNRLDEECSLIRYGLMPPVNQLHANVAHTMNSYFIERHQQSRIHILSIHTVNIIYK